MNFDQITQPLLGGVLIGASASALLLLSGRIFGVSGILAGCLLPKRGDAVWRLAALAGLVSAGFLLLVLRPESLPVDTAAPIWRYVAAGLLVGFGTRLGGGCTSGHGVCGIGRLSPRSVVATLCFIATGMITVALLRIAGVSL